MAKKFDDLTKDWDPERKARVEERVKAALAEMPLNKLRQAVKLSQERMAELLGVNQSEISKIEHRADMYVSTVRSYVQAMGGELDLVARMPDGDVRISNFKQVLDTAIQSGHNSMDKAMKAAANNRKESSAKAG